MTINKQLEYIERPLLETTDCHLVLAFDTRGVPMILTRFTNQMQAAALDQLLQKIIVGGGVCGLTTAAAAESE